MDPETSECLRGGSFVPLDDASDSPDGLLTGESPAWDAIIEPGYGSALTSSGSSGPITGNAQASAQLAIQRAPNPGDCSWRNTLLELEPGVTKRAGDCSWHDLDKVSVIQDEKDQLLGRIENASTAIWAHIFGGNPLPEFPDWWAFAPELAWRDVISMREAASELEGVVGSLDQLVMPVATERNQVSRTNSE